MLLWGLSLWTTWEMKTWFVSCVDSDVIGFTGRSITESSRSLFTACVWEQMWCVFKPGEHLTQPQHSSTSLLTQPNRCPVQRHHHRFNIKRPKPDRSVSGFQETAYDKTPTTTTLSSTHRFENDVRTIKNTQLDSNVTHSLKSPPTRMSLHRHCFCVLMKCLSLGSVWVAEVNQTITGKNPQKKTPGLVFKAVWFPYFLFIMNKQDAEGNSFPSWVTVVKDRCSAKPRVWFLT